jgi:hypothetical protein
MNSFGSRRRGSVSRRVDYHARGEISQVQRQGEAGAVLNGNDGPYEGGLGQLTGAEAPPRVDGGDTPRGVELYDRPARPGSGSTQRPYTGPGAIT